MPLTVSEAVLQSAVVDLALWRKWRVCHFRPARTSRGWRTPVEGHPGLPDLILARDGEVLLAELKAARGRPSPDQRLWLAALGSHGRLWTPKDWDQITEELA